MGGLLSNGEGSVRLVVTISLQPQIFKLNGLDSCHLNAVNMVRNTLIEFSVYGHYPLKFQTKFVAS